MSHSVQMPALGESVTEGTVTRWLKKEGDQVSEDEPLLEVSTDKVDTEVPAPYSGTLEKILVAEDETVDIGAELAIIGDGSGSGSGNAEPAEESVPAAAPAADSAPPAAEASPDIAAPPAADTPPAEAAPDIAARSDASDPGASQDDSPPDAPEGDSSSGTEVTMPAMGESVTEGTITRWMKSVGDDVAVDEPIVEIATDKVDAEVPSPVAGTLLRTLANEDDTVDVGSPIAVIGTAGSAAHAAPASAPAQPAPAAEPAPAPTPTQATEPAPPAAPERAPAPPTEQSPPPATPSAPAESRAPQAATPPAVASPAASSSTAPSSTAPSSTTSRAGGYVTPVVRKLAADKSVDIAAVQGTGVGGRIRREDVLAAATPAAPKTEARTTVPVSAGATTTSQAAAPAPPRSTVIPDSQATALAGTTQPAPRIRQSIARSMLQAVTTTAQSTTIVEVDVSRVVALRDRARDSFEGREGIKLTVLPFFVKAAIEAAKVYPIINSSLSDDLTEITYHPTVNMGITVDTPRGEVVPVVHRADDLNVSGLARHIADLAKRTRSGGLGPNELADATLTVSNSGSVGALVNTAIFVPPQSAIVALGSVVKRPVVVTDSDDNDVIAVRSLAQLALSYDQRSIDGADAARYLGTIKQRIESGDFEAELGL